MSYIFDPPLFPLLQLRRVMKGHEVKVYFKPTNTFRQILMQPKYKVIKEGVVYWETGRSLKSRFMEHRRPSSGNSEVSRCVNADQPDHSITLDKVRIWEVDPKSFDRRVREAIQIRINNPTLNKDACRYNLPPV